MCCDDGELKKKLQPQKLGLICRLAALPTLSSRRFLYARSARKHVHIPAFLLARDASNRPQSALLRRVQLEAKSGDATRIDAKYANFRFRCGFIYVFRWLPGVNFTEYHRAEMWPKCSRGGAVSIRLRDLSSPLQPLSPSPTIPPPRTNTPVSGSIRGAAHV